MQDITETKITIQTDPEIINETKPEHKIKTKSRNKKIDNNGLVLYDNNLKFIHFNKGVTQTDYNIFFSMITQFRETNDLSIFINYEQLQTLIVADDFTYDDVFEYVKKATEKIIHCVLRVENERVIQYFPMFEKIEIPKNVPKHQPYIKAKISSAFSEFIHNLRYGFNLVELYAFCNLKSRYSQTLFYLLKQSDNVGKVSLTWERFVEIMDFPEHFPMRDVDKIVLKPAVQELSNITSKNDSSKYIFKNLSYKKLKTKGEGNKITGIEFYFDVNADLVQQNNTTIVEGKIIPEIKTQTISQIVSNLQHYVGQVLQIKDGLLSVITKIYQGLGNTDGDIYPKYGIKVEQQTVNENKKIITFYESKTSFENWYNQYKI